LLCYFHVIQKRSCFSRFIYFKTFRSENENLNCWTLPQNTSTKSIPSTRLFHFLLRSKVWWPQCKTASNYKIKFAIKGLLVIITDRELTVFLVNPYFILDLLITRNWDESLDKAKIRFQLITFWFGVIHITIEKWATSNKKREFEFKLKKSSLFFFVRMIKLSSI
jgi:hypothetical protein